MAGDTSLLEAIRDAGFVYWGLFIAFGVILAAYLVWMRKAERAEGSDERAEGPPAGDAGEGDS